MTRTVVVTGTSTGIGPHIVRYLLKQPDVRVVGVSRRAAPDFGAADRYTHVTGDLTEIATRKSVAEAAGATLAGAVFNAGILSAVSRIANVDLDEFKRVMDVNLFSVLALTQDLLPALRAGHGRAIYVSSGASVSGYQAWAAYGASKAALNLVIRTLAAEEPGIVAVAVAPGVVDTPMQDDIRAKHVDAGEMGAEEAEKFRSLKAEGKLVKPEASGELYGRLALDASPSISGEYLRYDDPKLA